MAYELAFYSPLDRAALREAVRPAFDGVREQVETDPELADRLGFPELGDLDDVDRELLGTRAPEFRGKVDFRGQAFAEALVAKDPTVLAILHALVAALPGAVALDDYGEGPAPAADWLRTLT